MKIMHWLGVVYSLPHSCVSLLNFFAALSSAKKQK
jgi:hypothetical protein